VRIGLQIPDFTWPGGPHSMGVDLATIARTAEESGFSLLAVMDHFFQIGMLGPPEKDMLEAYTTLGYLAGVTSHATLLTLVTGNAYRHPGILVKQVTTLDVLSGGRAWLGIGAAWNEVESLGLGVPFPPVSERFERLEETLQIAHRMWSGDESPYQGRHYQLERPLNSPQPLSQPHPTIMVGGSGKPKMLRLVAKYADALNLFPSPELPRILDDLRRSCEREGRDYDAITKTAIYTFSVEEDGTGVDATLEQLRAFAAMGIQVVIGNMPEVFKLGKLERIGSDIIPAVAAL
jgi:F420-dependent oxidoreductase-like protein